MSYPSETYTVPLEGAFTILPGAKTTLPEGIFRIVSPDNQAMAGRSVLVIANTSSIATIGRFWRDSMTYTVPLSDDFRVTTSSSAPVPGNERTVSSDSDSGLTGMSCGLVTFFLP